MSELVRVFYAEDDGIGIEFPNGAVAFWWRGDTAFVVYLSFGSFMEATDYTLDDIEFVDVERGRPLDEPVEPALTEYTCCRAAPPKSLAAGKDGPADLSEREDFDGPTLIGMPVVIDEIQDPGFKRADHWPMMGPPNLYPPTGSAEWHETGGAPIKTAEEVGRERDCCA